MTAPVPAGVPTTVTVKVSKKGQKALKKATKAGKKGKATLTATLTDDLGQSAKDTTEGQVQAEEEVRARAGQITAGWRRLLASRGGRRALGPERRGDLVERRLLVAGDPLAADAEEAAGLVGLGGVLGDG